MRHDKVLVTDSPRYLSPVGVTNENDKLTLVQGIGKIDLDESMLNQLISYAVEKGLIKEETII